MTNSEKALQMHETWNGKIETTAKSHVNSREDLAIAYTPGVAEPCKVIAKDPDALTNIRSKRIRSLLFPTEALFLVSATSEPKQQCR